MRKLGDIAEIRFGPYLKGTESGTIKYLLASHFDKLAMPSKFDLSFIPEDSITNRELLKTNDLLLAGKGQRHLAWAYKEEFGPSVASSLFFVLRLDESIVQSEYLAQLLNSERYQHQLSMISGGHTIPSIPKKELEKLSVPIPTLKQQAEFVQMAEMLNENLALTRKLLSKKTLLRKSILNKMIANQIRDN